MGHTNRIAPFIVRQMFGPIILLFEIIVSCNLSVYDQLSVIYLMLFTEHFSLHCL